MDIANLGKIIKGEVSSQEKDLAAFSHDAGILEVEPKLVVSPKDVEDIENLVKYVSEHKSSDNNLSITARSAGSDMSGGPLNDSIIVNFLPHFNKIIEVGDDYGIAEPGVYYRDFEKATLAKDLFMPSYPASREICTVGGMVANNAGGEKTLKYGKTEDYIEELNMVLSDGKEYSFKALNKEELENKKALNTFEGEIYRKTYELIENNYDLIHKAKPNVSKNSAGYYLWNVWDRKTFDLNKLFVGSQGTLGLVTKVKFKLIHPAKHSRLLAIFLKDLKLVGEIVNDVMKFKPESFEAYDNNTVKLAIRFIPDILKQMKGNALILGFKFLPEIWLTLTGGIPKMILMAEFTGDDEKQIMKTAEEAEKIIREKYKLKTHITQSASESEKYWVIRRESFNLLRKHIKDKHTAPFIDDVVVRPDQLPQFLPQLNAMVGQYPSLIYTIAGHAGDGNFHIIPLMNLANPKDREIIPKLSDEVYNLVVKFKGSITAEHNDGLIRTPYLEKMYGPDVYKLFEDVKKIFDPLDIFNPRKKVGATKEYMVNHIKKE